MRGLNVVVRGVHGAMVVVVGMAALAAGLTGCSQATVKPKMIEIKVDPMVQVRNTLENYAKGQALSSEVTGFEQMVANVKSVSAEKAAILEKGLAEIQKPGADVKAKAKALLAELGLGAEKP
jgi:hypothetical protein